MKRIKKILVYLLIILIAFTTIGCSKKEKTMKVVNGYTDIGDLKLEQVQLPKEGEEIVVITTSMGVMKMRLFEDVAPKTTKYFKDLVSEGYYDGKLFSRIEKDFTNQIDYEKTFADDLENKEEYILEVDPNYIHITGSVSSIYQLGGYKSTSLGMIINSGLEKEELDAMDYVGEESYPKDTIEAYKHFGGAPKLDDKFTVFGQIFYGLDVLIEMNKVEVEEVGEGSVYNVPIEPIVIEKMEIDVYHEE